MTQPREFLEELFRIAVAGAHPAQCLPAHLPPPPEEGRLIVLAAGKAAGAMTEVAEQFYLAHMSPSRIEGLAVTRHGYARPTEIIEVIEAGHPVPDAAGLAAAQRTIDLAAMARPGDLVLVLMSGGASANWIAPAPGISLTEKQAVTRALLRSGANIGEINTVRKHLSRIKGGRLAKLAHRGQLVTLAISDVPGDDPAVIGSGPTVPDPTTLADARAIVERFHIEPPNSVRLALMDPDNETPKPGDALFRTTRFALVARPADAFDAARRAVEAAGYECVFLGANIEGEAREVAAGQAELAKSIQAEGRRAVILSGGELTVTMRGNGRGGPNQEFALALALALDGTRGICALSADTDGTDGGAGSAEDPAGAYVDGNTAMQARQSGLDPASFLAENNSTAFFSPLGSLVNSGPTCTNVNDFRAILVDRP